MSNPLQHGLTGSGRAARDRMKADDHALREADERAQQEARRQMTKKVKQTKWGAAKTPPTTDKARANLDTLAELIGDVVEAIQAADAREQVVQRATASQADAGRFPVIKPRSER